MKDKIPFYEIVNKFFVGAVFTIFFVIVTADKLSLIDLYNKYATILKDWSVLVATILLIAMYEIGFIINRAGSAFIAPLLEKTKIWPKKEYGIDVSEIKETNKNNTDTNNKISETNKKTTTNTNKNNSSNKTTTNKINIFEEEGEPIAPNAELIQYVKEVSGGYIIGLENKSKKKRRKGIYF